jgi:hypothetical protein
VDASKARQKIARKTLAATKADRHFGRQNIVMTSDNSNKNITYDKLFDVIDNDINDNNFKVAADFLYNAMTDWPTGLEDTQSLLNQLKKEVGSKLTYDNLDNYSRRLDLGVDAWKAEAVSSLLELFDFERKNVFDKNIELENIINKITQHYLADT